MALIDPKETRRVPIPHEPDEWVVLRPITARDLADLQREAAAGKLTPAENTNRILLKVLLSWSYPDLITLENLERLDHQTHTWLDEELLRTSGDRDDDEKKSLDSLSSPITDQEPANSLVSLAT